VRVYDAHGVRGEAVKDLDGRLVLVTGASGNLGRAVAHAFGHAGARLALVGRDLEGLRPIAGDLVAALGETASDPPPQLFAADLADLGAVDRLARDVEARCGPIDAVAHTAGAFSGGQPLVETAVETLDRMLRENLYSAFAIAHAILPAMLERGRGSLTLVAALAGLRGRPGLAAYCAAKSGVLRLMESLAEETRARGVRVNGVLPDAIAPTPGAVGTAPQAIADVMVFLASDAASAITGAAIPV